MNDVVPIGEPCRIYRGDLSGNTGHVVSLFHVGRVLFSTIALDGRGPVERVDVPAADVRPPLIAASVAHDSAAAQSSTETAAV